MRHQRSTPRSSGGVAGRTAAVIVLAACGGDATSPSPELASIAVTAPVGAVLAVDATVQLAAAARDTEGNPHGASLTWSSSAPSVATVTQSGVVMAVGPGSVTIEARSGAVAGDIDFTVVEVDEAAIRGLLTDPFTVRLVEGSGTDGGDPADALADADAALDAGDVLAARAAFTAVGAMAQTATAPDRRALLAVLDLIVDRAATHLGL